MVRMVEVAKVRRRSLREPGVWRQLGHECRTYSRGRGARLTVSRSPSAFVGTEISRRHAEFRVDGPVMAILDLDSRNGVFVNGTRCADASVAKAATSIGANRSRAYGLLAARPDVSTEGLLQK